jgi:hypothetical protein
VKRIDRDAMRRAIDWMRAKSPDHAKEIEHKLEHEGFEAAGEFAADAAQCANLKLKSWETPPCNIWGYINPAGSNCATVFWRPDSASSNLIRSRRSRKR